MVVFECNKEDVLESPKAEPMQIPLMEPSRRLVCMLLSVSIKLVSGAPNNILFELVVMGYIVFIRLELIKMKGK